MGTTFVSQVDRPTLAIIVPVLGRGLRDRDVQTKRKCCVVVDNMCKLVCDAKDVEPFVDKLLPELKKVEEDVPIPEIRAYGAKAKATLVKAIKDGARTEKEDAKTFRALHWAAKCGRPADVQALVDAKADLDARTKASLSLSLPLSPSSLLSPLSSLFLSLSLSLPLHVTKHSRSQSPPAGAV